MSSPFRQPPNGPSFYAGGQAGAAELKLKYVFEEGLDAAAVIGEPGLGKTTLLRRYAARAKSVGHTVVDIFFPDLDVEGLLSLIMEELGGASSSDAARDAKIRHIAAHARRLPGRRSLTKPF